jgi:glutamate-1-semialdehyde aminotransferase
MDAAAYIRQQANKMFKEKGINGRYYGRSIVHLYLGPIDFEPADDFSPPTRDVRKIINPAATPIKTLLGLHLLQRGISTLNGRFFIMSAVHTKKDIDETMEGLASSLDDMKSEGAFANI